jgi:DNA-binding GntR family transcriptional regulator
MDTAQHSMYLNRSRAVLAEAVRCHHKIVSALSRDDGTEVGRLLREHSESFAEDIQKAKKG